MISVTIYKNKNNEVYSFEVKNHSNSHVCAAVSAISINAVNSIKTLTNISDHNYTLTVNNCGYIFFEVKINKIKSNNSDVSLLLNSFYLGITSIKQSYPKEIKITEV